MAHRREATERGVASSSVVLLESGGKGFASVALLAQALSRWGANRMSGARCLTCVRGAEPPLDDVGAVLVAKGLGVGLPAGVVQALHDHPQDFAGVDVRRLLDELSWEGNARKYRDGGPGLENVLTAEVFQALDFLPRQPFLAKVLAELSCK